MDGLPTFRAIWRVIRPGRRAAITVAVLAGAVLAMHGIENARARQAWEAYSTQAAARGVEFSLAQLIPDPQVPDGENFAKVPLIQAGIRARQGEGPQPTEFDLPHGSLDSLNDSVPADLRTLRSALVSAGWVVNDLTTPDGVICARGLARLDMSLGQLREGVNRRYARYPRDLDHPEKIGVPPFLLLRKVAQALYLRFESHVAAGQLDAACEDLELSLRIARSLDEAPTVVGAMIEVAITALPAQNLSNWLHTAPWTEAHLQRFSAALAPIDLLRAYRAGIAVERACLTHIGRAAANGTGAALDVYGFASVSEGSMDALDKCAAAMKRAAWRLYPRGWHLQSVVWANQNCYDAADSRISPERHRWDPSTSLDFDALFARFNSADRLRYALACIAVPNFARAEARTIAIQARVDLARVAVALELERLAKGAYPAELRELAPASLAALPNDLTDGQPLRYRRAPDGAFSLYSLSYNRVDDGGSTDQDPTAPAIGSFAQTLDWTWSSRSPEKKLAMQSAPLAP